MSRWSTLAALLLVALWLPATLHCQVERLDLSELFSCASHSDESDHADNGSDCADTLCQTVESGQIVFTKTKLQLAPSLAQACVYHLCLLTGSARILAPEIVSPDQDQMLPWQRTWQFVRRTALPARAPDSLA